MPTKAAEAAPFCVKATGLPAECWYYDITSCKSEAQRRQAFCTANPEEMRTTASDGPICLVDSSMVPLCMFQTSQACNQEAQMRNGVCFSNIAQEAETDIQLADDRTGKANEVDMNEIPVDVDTTDIPGAVGNFDIDGTQAEKDALDPFIGRPTYQ